MPGKTETLSQLENEYNEFRSRIANLDDAAYSETFLGEWNLSQLLAHMAGWWQEMSGAFGRVKEGQRPTPEGVDYSDSDSWNAKFAAKAQDGKAALTGWDQAFQGYLAAAKSLGDDMYGEDPQSGRARIGNRLLGASGLDHFAEHRPQIEEWLAGRGK